jgi:hypothetical protein
MGAEEERTAHGRKCVGAVREDRTQRQTKTKTQRQKQTKANTFIINTPPFKTKL